MDVSSDLQQQDGEALGNPIVLLVDDQQIIAEGIRKMLTDDPDITLHYCNDPRQAINKAIEISATVILQDLVMPEVDGYTLLRFYRKHPRTAAIPVIVLSSKEDPADKSEAFSQGANDYLVKLPDKIELVARIRAQSQSYLLQLAREEAFRKLHVLQKELEIRNAELQRLSSVDGLTGIANRRHFDERLDQEFKRALRENLELSLILIDVDFFKPFNDNYGHQMGDDCLRAVAAALAGALHRPGDFVARYGGEEFVVVLPGTDAKGAMVTAEALRTAVESKNVKHEFSKAAKHVTISLGIASTTPRQGMLPKMLIVAADSALYEAKEGGRNRYKVATDEQLKLAAAG